MSEYQCAKCGGVFQTGWSDEEAKAELAEAFPGWSTEHCDLWCDDCYKILMGTSTPGEVEQ